eukprot:364787-Chlamydomonas_euryale.AAC.3
MVPFRVTVYTSDVRGAGTDGEVYIAMKGEWGSMGETRLENARSNFERAKVDVFEIMGSDIGPVQEITIRLVRGSAAQPACARGAWCLRAAEEEGGGAWSRP